MGHMYCKITLLWYSRNNKGQRQGALWAKARKEVSSRSANPTLRESGDADASRGFFVKKWSTISSDKK